MKIKHICSFFALCCAMNISDLSATMSKVHEVFKDNINKNLNGGTKDVIRNCSYLNQLSTVNELCKIVYKCGNNFSAAVDKVVGRVMELPEGKSSEGKFADAFKSLRCEYKIAVIFSLEFLTDFMHNTKDWVSTFGEKYSEDIEGGVKGLVAGLRNNYSNELNAVDTYYYSKAAVDKLKEAWGKVNSKVNLNKDKSDAFNATIDLVCAQGYEDVYDKYRKVDGTAVFAKGLAENKAGGDAEYTMDVCENFDILTSWFARKDSGALRKESGSLGDFIGGVRDRHEAFSKSLKQFVELNYSNMETAEKNLVFLKEIGEEFGVSEDVWSVAKGALKFIEGCNNLEVRIGREEGKDSVVVDKAGAVTEENYLEVLDAISKLGDMKPFAAPKELESLAPVKGAQTKFETFKEIKNAAQLKAFEKSKTAFLGEFENGEKYSAEKIEALKSSEDCDKLFKELKAAFDNLKVANDLLGDKKVNIDGVNDKYNNAVTLIKNKKDEITEAQNDEVEKKKGEVDRLVKELSNLLNDEKYSAEKIKALKSSEDCDKLFKELKAAFDSLDTANNLLGDKKVNIDGVNDKYNNAVTLIKNKKDEITEAQNDEVEKKKALEKSKEEFLGEFENGEKYSAEKIKALKSSEDCDKLFKELKAAFDNLKVANDLLGDKKVNIDDVTKKYEDAVTLINKKKDEIEKGQEEQERNKKALEESKTAFLGEFENGKKYGADTIKALKSSEGCDKLLDELNTAFDNLDTANNLLGDKKVNIDGVNDKYNNAVTLIKNKKDEITEAQNDEVEKKKDEANRLVKELSNLLNDEKYNAVKIGELDNVETCEAMLKEIGDKFGEIENLNKKLGENAVGINDVTKKYEEAVTLIKNKKGEIDKAQNDEVDEENEERKEDDPADLDEREEKEHEEGVGGE